MKNALARDTRKGFMLQQGRGIRQLRGRQHSAPASSPLMPGRGRHTPTPTTTATPTLAPSSTLTAPPTTRATVPASVAPPAKATTPRVGSQRRRPLSTLPTNSPAVQHLSRVQQQGKGAFSPLVLGILCGIAAAGLLVAIGRWLLRKWLLPVRKVKLPPSGATPWERVRPTSQFGPK